MKTLEKIYTSFMSGARVGGVMARNVIVGWCMQFIHPERYRHLAIFGVKHSDSE